MSRREIRDEEEKAMQLWRQSLEWCSHKLRHAHHHEKLEEAKNAILPWTLQREVSFVNSQLSLH